MQNLKRMSFCATISTEQPSPKAWRYTLREYLSALIKGGAVMQIGKVLAASVVLFCSATAYAADVNPDSNATKWRSYSSGNRSSYAAMASIMCQSRDCNRASIKACMDEVTRPPASAGVGAMTIGELAINCIKMIKAQE